MILNSRFNRRLFGSCCLIAAIIMLVMGETALEDRFSPVAFVLYWGGCFGFTLLALLTALVDMRNVRLQGQGEHRSLFENALREIEKEKQNRQSPPKNNGQP